jgi:predicted nuclease of restriction endonuclease-like (RecB) superfamily
MYERSLIASKSLKVARNSSKEKLINIFKDPYVFEFLDLPELHSETDLERL